MNDPRVDEYNYLFRTVPNRWTDLAKDIFAFDEMYKLPIDYPEKLLDIGCGNGHTIEVLRNRWKDTEYWGLDISDVAIELAKKRNPDATFICAPIEKAILPKFDMVTSIGTFEHFPVLHEAFGYLKNFMKGYAYIEVPNCIGYPSSKKEEGFRRLTIGSKQIEWHLFRSTWERIIEESGLEIVKSITGPSIYCEFIWILKVSEE